MAAVARELSLDLGVLEPLQTENSVKKQVKELKNILEEYGHPPLILVGFSWGAWLSYILTGAHPSLVKKLILISCGPFEEKYVAQIAQKRLSRLKADENREVSSLLSSLNPNSLTGAELARFGGLMSKSDSYDPLPQGSEELEFNPDIFRQVWGQASRLRSSGELLELGRRIQCPVVAIHGDDDPHPSEGVREPLSRVLRDFRFIRLKQCGHRPWLERNAKNIFYATMRREIGLLKEIPPACDGN